MTNFKKMSLWSGAVLLFSACNVVEPDSTFSGPSSSANDKTALIKRLVLVDHKEVRGNTFGADAVWHLDGIASNPKKFKIFEGEAGFAIRDICRSSGLGKIYFSYDLVGAPSEKSGLWSVTSDGKTVQQILKESHPSLVPAGPVRSLDFDKWNKKIYFGCGANVDRQQLFCCNEDGSGLEKITGGIPAEVSSFAVDGKNKRIYFTYQKDGHWVVGCSDLQGNMIRPVVSYTGAANSADRILLNTNQNTAYIYSGSGGTLLSFGTEGQNQMPVPVFSGYSPLVNGNILPAIDFGASKVYYGLAYDAAVEVSDMEGVNIKNLCGGFHHITSFKMVTSY